jgi:hypothetical protein
MSIVRIGLSETKHFADGYDTIFGKRSKAAKKPAAAKRKAAPRKKAGKRK